MRLEIDLTKFMKKLLLTFVSVFILSFQVSAQEIKLDVKGVELGTKKSEVIKKLGKPSSTNKNETDDCGTQAVLYLNYSGLKLALTENDETQELFVSLIEINSSKWKISKDIKVGMSKKDVQEKLGKGKSYIEGENEYISYLIKDKESAYTELIFYKNKLIEISWMFNFC